MERDQHESGPSIHGNQSAERDFLQAAEKMGSGKHSIIFSKTTLHIGLLMDHHSRTRQEPYKTQEVVGDPKKSLSKQGLKSSLRGYEVAKLTTGADGKIHIHDLSPPEPGKQKV